jgi:hypothetical protein
MHILLLLFAFLLRQARNDCGVGFSVGLNEGTALLVGNADGFQVGDDDGEALGADDGDSMNSIEDTSYIELFILVTAAL